MLTKTRSDGILTCCCRERKMIFCSHYGRQWTSILDFPGGLVVKNLHASVGDMASMLGLGRIPHATEHLSPCAATTKPVLQLLRPASPEPMLCNRRSHRSAKARTRTKRVSSTCPKWRKPVYDNEHTAQPKK